MPKVFILIQNAKNHTLIKLQLNEKRNLENEKLKFVKLFLEKKRIARGNFFSFPFKLESLTKKNAHKISQLNSQRAGKYRIIKNKRKTTNIFAIKQKSCPTNFLSRCKLWVWTVQEVTFTHVCITCRRRKNGEIQFLQY